MSSVDLRLHRTMLPPMTPKQRYMLRQAARTLHKVHPEELEDDQIRTLVSHALKLIMEALGEEFDDG